MRVIDAHAHLIETIAGTGAGGELRHCGNGRARYANGQEFQALPPRFSSGQVTAEDLLAVMNEQQVERAVLLQGNYFGFQNLYSLEAQQRYPDRFRAAASYDPFSRDRDGIRRYLFETCGIGIVKFECSTGSGLMCNHRTFPLDGEVMEEEYRYADEHGLILVMDIGKLGAESWQVEAVRTVALRHPGMQIVVCHLLAPSRTTGAEMAAGLARLALPNISFDLAALPHNIQPEPYPYETAQRYILEALRIVGQDHILFGSDIPSTLKEADYGKLIGYIRDADCFDEETKECLLFRNAQRIYFPDLR